MAKQITQQNAGGSEPSLNTRPRSGRPADPTAVIAKWIPRFGLPLAILAWIGVTLIILWLAGHILHTLVLLAFAGLLAYALAPAAKFLERVMPRVLAILAVFLIVLGAVGVLFYVIITASIVQVISLSDYVRFLLTPSSNGQATPFEQGWRSIGISQDQITGMRDLVLVYIQGMTGSIVPILTGLVSAVLDVVLVAFLSIYLLIDGSRLSKWLRGNMPLLQQGSVSFFLDTVQRVVGGYIRGQLILCGTVGVLVGAGMQVIGVPYALLLGVLAFFLEFVPILGTLLSGAICVLLALTQGWVMALVVLLYFVVIHLIESNVLAPRIVGETIGLNPVVSIAALLAGLELFGVGGALFAAPVAGVLQALLIAFWMGWRAAHSKQFPTTEQELENLEEILTAEAGELKPSKAAT